MELALWTDNRPVEEIEKDEDESQSRPDFLVLEARISDDDKLQLSATVTECKMSSVS